MKNKSAKVTLTISIILLIGFFLSGLSYFFSFQSFFKSDVEAVSSLTSENIYANINNLMDRPINVSIAMAHDTFLRDFTISETAQGFDSAKLDTIKNYLASYQKKYEFDSVFFVSTKTGNYYHFNNGLDRTMSHENPDDNWYFNFLEGSTDCSLNVDNDVAKNDVITIFVNCKLYDSNNNLLGVVGVGMETPYIQQFLTENEENYNIHAYLIDETGNIKLSSKHTEFENINLFDNDEYEDISEAVKLNTYTPNERWYSKNGIDGYVITRYVSNLNWFLIVEKNTAEFKTKMTWQVCLNVFFLLFILIIIIKIIAGVIKKYNLSLTKLADYDYLTDIKNRASYARDILEYSTNIKDCKTFGIGVFDLNNFKFINDKFGHQVGDEYLKTFSRLLTEAFVSCSVYRIGGDEFVVILKDIPEETVIKYWNDLKNKMTHTVIQKDYPISSAFGYSFYDTEVNNTVEKVFKDADDKMYKNKERHVEIN